MSTDCPCDEFKVDCFCNEWPQRLRDRFPQLFTEPCSIECFDGWEKLLTNLCQELQDCVVKHNLDCYPSQIKEKYGTLRFYMSTETDEISSLIEGAEKLSHTTCEICGNPGKLTKNGSWLRTRCPSCE